MPGEQIKIGFPTHPQVEFLRTVPQFQQRSPEWYERRRSLMTASNCAAALSIKPFASFQGCPRREAIMQIVYGTFKGNVATRHGQAHEDLVRDKFDEIMHTTTEEFGLIVHSDVHGPEHGLDWLGASPDGIITELGALLEIKCPYKRQITDEIPHHYVPQCLVQMEVCDLPLCYFVEYQPDWLSPTGEEILSIKVIERDPVWFEKNKPILKSFYDELMYEREHYTPPPPPPKLIRDGLYNDLVHSSTASSHMFLDDEDDDQYIRALSSISRPQVVPMLFVDSDADSDLDS